MEIIYKKDDIKSLFKSKKYISKYVKFGNITNKTSKIDFLGFPLRFKFELVYIRNKFEFTYYEENQLILYIRDINNNLLDTQIVQPYKDLFFILKNRDKDFEKYIFLCIPNNKKSFELTRVNIRTLKGFDFMIFKEVENA